MPKLFQINLFDKDGDLIKTLYTIANNLKQVLEYMCSSGQYYKCTGVDNYTIEISCNAINLFS